MTTYPSDKTAAAGTTEPVVDLNRVGPPSAAVMLGVIHEAFGARAPLDPPAAALAETVETLAAALAAHGGLLAEVDGEPAGALVLDPVGRTLWLRRVGVIPRLREHHVAAGLVQAAALLVAADPAFDELAVLAREELPETVGFWERQGFHEVRRETPDVELRRAVRTVVRHAPDAEATRAMGERLASDLRAGDLVVLTGSLGAGKTTFTQGLGAGLGVRGPITSPTFVIARVHPSLGSGPALVHVDAYRLGGLAELDDLDLDTDLARAVTVVEWGEGLAEGLADSRLDVRIVRGDETRVDDVHGIDERRLEVTPVGPRWDDAPLLAATGTEIDREVEQT